MNKLEEDFLRPFNPQHILTMHSFMLHIKEFGLDVNDVVEICDNYIEGLVKDLPPEAKKKAVHKKSKAPQTSATCPDCGSGIEVTVVNISRCTNVGGDWKTSIACLNTKCLFTELSLKSVQEWRETNGL